MPQRSYPLPPVSLFFVSHLLPKAFFELSVCLTPICTHNYNMDRAAHRGVTEEGGLTAAAAPAAAAAAGLIFQSLSLPLLCNIDVANTMLLPTDSADGRTDSQAGRLPSAQTVTQTRRLLQRYDGRTDGDAASAIAVYKRAPLKVREQQAERNRDSKAVRPSVHRTD